MGYGQDDKHAISVPILPPTTPILSLEPSSTIEMDDDNECEVKDEDVPHCPSWIWRQSSFSASLSFAIVHFNSKEQLIQAKDILLEMQAEEERIHEDRIHDAAYCMRNQIPSNLPPMELRSYLQDTSTEYNLGWSVSECCCTKDVPHGVEDKFVLLSTFRERSPFMPNADRMNRSLSVPAKKSVFSMTSRNEELPDEPPLSHCPRSDPSELVTETLNIPLLPMSLVDRSIDPDRSPSGSITNVPERSAHHEMTPSGSTIENIE